MSQYNVLNFLKQNLRLKSVIPFNTTPLNHCYQCITITMAGTSYIDHILASDAWFTQNCVLASIFSSFTTDSANSDHDPIIATFTFAIAPSIEPETVPSINRHFKQIAAIPVYIPKIDDEEAKNMLLESGWYHPDLTCILKDQKDPSLEIRQELHKASDATDFTLLTNSIDRATRTDRKSVV